MNECLCVCVCVRAYVSVTQTNLQNEKSLVDIVFDHGGVFSISFGDVVSPDVEHRLNLLQKQHQLELLTIVLLAQWTLKQGLSTKNALWCVTLQLLSQFTGIQK